MFFICVCGDKFNEDQEGAVEHILEQHLDLVETRFDELLDEAESDGQEVGYGDLDDALYDEAIEDTLDDLLDLVPEA